jgi:hypothetical protein
MQEHVVTKAIVKRCSVAKQQHWLQQHWLLPFNVAAHLQLIKSSEWQHYQSLWGMLGVPEATQHNIWIAS